MENEGRDPRRNWVLVPAKQLLIWGKFATYQETMTQLMLHTMVQSQFEAWFPKNPIPIFVSHRWDAPQASIPLPDPLGRQFHIVMRFIVEAICLSKGICERFFSYADPEIVLSSKLRSLIQNHQVKFTRGLAEWPHDAWGDDRPGQGIFGPPMEILLAQWLHNNFESLHFESDEIINISNILRDVIVWYDYSSLPQRPFASREDEEYHLWALGKIEHLISGANTVIIWDQPGVKRGWCVLEGLIAETVQNASYHAVPNTRLPNANWLSAVFNLDPKYANQHPNKQLAQSVHELRQSFLGKGSEYILEQFRARDIKCTRDDDLAIVATIIHRFISQNS
jgi:hypothetical protein